jgi:hypothetical protein
VDGLEDVPDPQKLSEEIEKVKAQFGPTEHFENLSVLLYGQQAGSQADSRIGQPELCSYTHPMVFYGFDDLNDASRSGFDRLSESKKPFSQDLIVPFGLMNFSRSKALRNRAWSTRGGQSFEKSMARISSAGFLGISQTCKARKAPL